MAARINTAPATDGSGRSAGPPDQARIEITRLTKRFLTPKGEALTQCHVA